MRRFAAFLNRVLTPTGLELRARARTLPEQQALPRLASAGRIIEFVGTQGIGKSTLSNDVQKLLKDRWFFRSDLQQVGPAPDPDPEMENIHRDLYFQRLKWLKKNRPDAWHSITRSRQAARVIGESLTLMTNDFPRGFILDEGLFKNFPNEIVKRSDRIPERVWHGRALVHLRARDAASVVARYRNRAAERTRHGLLQRVPEDSALQAQVEEDTALFDRMLEIARARGSDTLVLHAETAHEDNVARFLDFERSLFVTASAPS